VNADPAISATPASAPISRTALWIIDWTDGSVVGGGQEAAVGGGHWSVADGPGEKLKTPLGESMLGAGEPGGRFPGVPAISGSAIGKNGVRPVASLRSAEVHMGMMPGKTPPCVGCAFGALDAADDSISRKAVGD